MPLEAPSFVAASHQRLASPPARGLGGARRAAARPESTATTEAIAPADSAGSTTEEKDAAKGAGEEEVMADPTSGGVAFLWLGACLVLYYVYIDIALGGRCLPSGLNLYGKFCDSGSMGQLAEDLMKHPLYFFVG
mmetsp:Transcript_68857/g.156027  ORF Transcript_68857/g.156027 Transcript_68857/m.156027 type:complete len:135 (-) Transcript_68857:27-431(-)